MRAAVVEAFGGPETVQVMDVPDPVPRDRQVLIEVVAAAVNPVDLATRQGLLHDEGLHGGPPLRLGWDVAGVVTEVGPGVLRLRRGQFVIGLSDRLTAPSKTHAEKVVLDEDSATAVPASLDPITSSTLPLAGATAWQALELASLRPGATVLVTGAAGNVGAMVTQLALVLGARVISAGRPEHRAPIEAYGATFVEAERLSEAVRDLVPRGVDAAVDAASIGTAALDAVRDRGRHVSLVVTRRPAPLRGIDSISLAVRADWEHLAILESLHSSGALWLPRPRTFALADAASAHAAATTERVTLVP